VRKGLIGERVCDRVNELLTRLGESGRGLDAICGFKKNANRWGRMAHDKEWGVKTIETKNIQARKNARELVALLAGHLAPPADMQALSDYLFYGRGTLPDVRLVAVQAAPVTQTPGLLDGWRELERRILTLAVEKSSEAAQAAMDTYRKLSHLMKNPDLVAGRARVA
jgi:hypothetical protein